MPSISTRRFQESLLQTASELSEIDGRLAALTEAIEPRLGRVLPGELRGGAQCVRTDLLRDAIDTLRELGRATEQSVLEKRLEIGAAVERIAAFG